MKILICGGSGFVGSHTADALSDRGHEVTIFDLIDSPYQRSEQEMIVGDILDRKAVEDVVKGCDAVYNFAGMADIEASYNKPVESIENNIMGNTFILEACRKNKVKRFVFASTIYVYSTSGSFYRGSKQACEIIIEIYKEAFKLPYTILRYGSLYGPRSPENNWIHRIIKQAITQGKITRYGDGEEIREYIHVKDAAELSAKILSKEFENKNVIITGNQPMKIKDLHIMVKEMLGNKIKLEFLPSTFSSHYEITPYNFNPKAAKKLVSTEFYDLGQGILELLSEINAEIDTKKVIKR